MADRSYLYASNHAPDSTEWQSKRDLHGISEYSYAIPLTFKILLSGNPIATRSSIWATSEKLAISGNYQLGVRNLEQFLSRISEPKAAPLVEEAIQFLRDPRNVREHFILECGEIFDLTKGSLEEKNYALLNEIEEISSSLDSIELPSLVQPGFLSRLFSNKNRPFDPLTSYYEIGLGFWSDILYFDFSENET